ncbi:MAG TPA: hypothetical protein VFC71_03400 [Candidatus Polarisedimenticolia bacterium]|nr:hypothetical protein [Candidatus Polarisedimenticolia bacterium]
MTTGRQAGFCRLADGRTVTWSLADGRRGRRWRTMTTDPNGGLESALLLELAPDGGLSKVELATADGLLSLHPEGELLHGNVVSAEGVRHVRVGWSDGHVLVIEGSIVTLAAAAIHAAPDGAGESRPVGVVVVGSQLRTGFGEADFERLSRTTIGVNLGEQRHVIELDELGIPLELRSGRAWPLELD